MSLSLTADELLNKFEYLGSLVREHHRGAEIMRHVLVSLIYGDGFSLPDVKYLDGENYRLMLDLLEYERERKIWPQTIVELAEYARERINAGSSI